MPALLSRSLTERGTPAVMEMTTSGSNNTWQILALTGFWCFLALVVVSLRLYTRTVMVKYFGWDDIATVITMILGIGIWICFLGEAHWGLGQHQGAISTTELEMFMRYQFAHSMLLVWALQGMKIAFMLFLVRLSVRRLFRVTIFTIVGFMTMYTLVNWLTILLACAPISANWNMKPARCLSASVYTGLGLSNSVLGMVTDAVLALIPIPIVSGLQLNWRTKVCLIVAFGMGMITVACGAAKTYYQYRYIGDTDRLYHDQYFVWGALELYVGIIAASLVSLKPLIGSFLDKAKSTFATSAALAKSLHYPGSPKMVQSPRFNEKEEADPNQQLDTQHFPKIEVSSMYDDAFKFPDSPMQSTRPQHSPLFSNPLSEKSPVVAAHEQFPYLKPAKKLKRRPAPLDTAALMRREASLEIPSIGGVLLSPSPTYLPSGQSLDFFDLIRGRSPEAIQQSQSRPATIASTRTISTVRSSLVMPSVTGILTSPSPTYLPAGTDLNFFDLIRGRDPEILAKETNISRPGTICSVLEDNHVSRRGTLSCMRESKWLSGDFSEATAMMQTMKKVSSSEIRRRPSIAPSATSVYLCLQDSPRESQMFFNVIPATQFSSVTSALPPPESPLSPLSVDPKDTQFSDSSMEDVSDTRGRMESSEMLIKKEE